MTLFEYLSVAVSIVLSLSAAQILANLRAVLDPDRRYWVHALWVIQALLVHVIYWWGFWAYRELESWNFAFFAFVLLNPGLIFVCSNTLVLGVRGPDASWEQHFFSVRKWFFVMWGAMAVVATLRNWLVLSTPVLAPGRLPMLVVMIVCGVGLYSTDRRVHGALVIVSLFTVSVATAYLWFQPGLPSLR